jgi:hypothetical protein
VLDDYDGRTPATRAFADVVRSSPELHHAVESMAGNRQSITEFLSDKVAELRDTATVKGWQGRFLMGQVNEIDVAKVADDLAPVPALPASEPRRMGFVAALVASRQQGTRGRS